MITLLPAPAPSTAGIIQDVLRPSLVLVQDPTGEDPFFRKPRLGAQRSVRQIGGMEFEHVVQLAGGKPIGFRPSWITECPNGLVIPLRPIAELS